MRHRIRNFVAGAMLLAAPAFSQGLNFTATLDSIRIQGRTGQTYNRNFLLKLDQSAKPTQFRAQVQDWWRSEDFSQSFYREPGTLARSCGKWVSLNPVEARVQGGETLDVRITIAVPTGIEPGGYWCALTVDQLPDPLAPVEEGVRVNFLASVSTGIFIYLDPVQRAASISSVEVLPGEARVTLHNDGNTPLGVEGRFEFVGQAEGKAPIVVPIPRETILTEPSRTGTLKAKLPDIQTLPPGEYTVKAILDIGIENLIGAQKRMEVRR